jgi:hypothetical protein
MLFDCFLRQGAKSMWIYRVEFYRNAAEPSSPRVTLFCGAGREIPFRNLPRLNRQPFEVDLSLGRKLSQRFLDLVGGIYAARIVVAQMVDVGRSLFL